MMTPFEKAVEAGEKRGTSFGFMQFNEADARAIITAFLEAAAEDGELCERIGKAAQNPPPNHLTTRAHDEGQTAILALKETING